jgi:arylsulfatase A-like enzyme/Tfp pilus assembly protein PilF
VLWQLRPGHSGFPAFITGADQNVLLITIDTLRADALASYGGRAVTPNLDRLARDGVRFTFAHAHAVVTLPSHASLLTGRYPFDHGVRDNTGFRLTDSARTLSELARDRGIATAAFVGAFPLDRQFGLAQGFEVYDDVGGRELAPAEFRFSERRAEEVVARAREWIEQQQRPWLAWVHVFDPHAPYAPPAPFDRQYAGDPYAGEVAYVDHALAPVLDIARRGPRRTTVVVTADHGEGLGEHGEATHGTFAYESTLRVPLILAQVGPASGDRQRGFDSDVPARHIDVLPTLAALLELNAPTDLPGQSLLTARDGESMPQTSYFEAMTASLKRGWAPLRGVIVDREKYIDLPIVELYDLAADPREARNLAPDAEQRVRVHSAQLAALGSELPGEQTAETADVRARLQSLGYLSGSARRKAHYSEDDDPKRLIDLDRLMIQGIELRRAGRAGDAIEAYRQVIARRPDMGLAYRWLAFIQWEGGANAAAIQTLREALQRTGPDVEVEIRLGTYLAETGATNQAVPMLERVASADPENTEGLNALGIAYARAGRTADALRTFQQILVLSPRDAFALENIGTVHLQRNDMLAAGEAFRKALESDPRSSRAEAGLGVIALKAGRRDDAIEHWRRAVALDRTNLDALYNLATELVNAGRLSEARPYLEQFVRTAPPALYGEDIARMRRLLGSG